MEKKDMKLRSRVVTSTKPIARRSKLRDAMWIVVLIAWVLFAAGPVVIYLMRH